jgi:hypothetical protein
MSAIRILMLALLAAGLGMSSDHLVAGASSPGQDRSGRIEGAWVRTDPEGSGSFGGLAANFPQAVLTPEAAGARGGGGGRGGRGGGGRGAAPAEGRGPLRPGEAVIAVTMPCGGRAGGAGYGGALITPDSVGVHFVQSKDEVILAGERAGVRHIYIDGRKHPDRSRWTPVAAGHSIGWYEGDVLVVETVGFSPGAVPGGGMRSPETTLTERFTVSPDGGTMTVHYTWTDPAIFAQPHSYLLIFERAPAFDGLSWALEEWCDASDPEEQQSIVAPEQLR